MRNLPLVIPNQAELEQSAHVFLQGKNLPKSPFHSERLTGRDVGATLLPVDFPVGSQVCAGSLVFGDVERCATRYIVTPISAKPDPPPPVLRLVPVMLATSSPFA